MNITELKAFAAKVHENAKAHGFWEGERNEGEIIALIVSEASEAFEGFYFESDSAKIPGFSAETEELADGFIRVLDFMMFKGFEIGIYEAEVFETWIDAVESFESAEGGHVMVACNVLVLYASRALEAMRKGDHVSVAHNLNSYLAFCMWFCDQYNIRLWEAMNAKHEYNINRPYKHGKRF